MKQKHTKAPWVAVKNDKGWRVETLRPKIRKVVAYLYGNRAATIAEADAHLIAAAPDLLSALKTVTYSLIVRSSDRLLAEAVVANAWSWPDSAPQFVRPDVSFAISAIAKAEGRS
ncbi:hypothetical protein QBK99_11200 [Corticibacterium sp. UT-5YL-CI-8]|nr:hypothetical protein [Tianweitania sp. UT-5YL-CI-8]